MRRQHDIPEPRDSSDQSTLLLRRNPETEKWAWKRTNGPWIGGHFDTAKAAAADAERLGFKPPYVTIFMETGE
jgi:hypothetical protein